MPVSQNTLPPAVKAIYDAAVAALLKEGSDQAAAESQAWRDVQRAGWYETADEGWKQIGPNLTGKVNTRKLEKQPDGTFMVRGVPVLYPNAIKGADKAGILDAKRIGDIAKNTNTEFASCGRKPGVVLDHPIKGGDFKPAFGGIINFRPTEANPDTYECDIVGLAAGVADAWAQSKILGLSPGLISDAGGLNERVGHLALLGANAPAMSRLPNTEVHYASSDSMVCFSAESAHVQPTGSPAMDYSKHKAAAEKMLAAYAAVAAGEPDAEKKVEEAHKEFASHPMPGKKADEQVAAIGAQVSSAHADYAATRKKHGIYKKSDMKGKWHLDYDSEDDIKDIPERKEADPNSPVPKAEDKKETDAQFAAVSSRVTALEAVNTQQAAALAKFAEKAAKDEFVTFIGQAVKDGHQFSAEEANNQFSACQGNPVVVNAIKSVILSTPKTINPSLTAGMTGNLSDGSGVGITEGHNFSAEAAVEQCSRLGINPAVARIMLGLPKAIK